MDREEKQRQGIFDTEKAPMLDAEWRVRELQPELVAAGIPVHVVGGADEAAELDAKRAIDQGTRVAAAI